MLEMTPGQIAEFDQAFTASTHILTELVISYVTRQREFQEQGIPVQLNVMAMAETLADEWEVEAVVSALAAAVVVLGDHISSGNPCGLESD